MLSLYGMTLLNIVTLRYVSFVLSLCSMTLLIVSLYGMTLLSVVTLWHYFFFFLSIVTSWHDFLLWALSLYGITFLSVFTSRYDSFERCHFTICLLWELSFYGMTFLSVVTLWYDVFGHYYFMVCFFLSCVTESQFQFLVNKNITKSQRVHTHLYSSMSKISLSVSIYLSRLWTANHIFRCPKPLATVAREFRIRKKR